MPRPSLRRALSNVNEKIGFIAQRMTVFFIGPASKQALNSCGFSSLQVDLPRIVLPALRHLGTFESVSSLASGLSDVSNATAYLENKPLVQVNLMAVASSDRGVPPLSGSEALTSIALFVLDVPSGTSQAGALEHQLEVVTACMRYFRRLRPGDRAQTARCLVVGPADEAPFSVQAFARDFGLELLTVQGWSSVPALVRSIAQGIASGPAIAEEPAMPAPTKPPRELSSMGSRWMRVRARRAMSQKLAWAFGGMFRSRTHEPRVAPRPEPGDGSATGMGKLWRGAAMDATTDEVPPLEELLHDLAEVAPVREEADGLDAWPCTPPGEHAGAGGVQGANPMGFSLRGPGERLVLPGVIWDSGSDSECGH